MKSVMRARAMACVVVILAASAPSAFARGGGRIEAPSPLANFSLSREFYFTFPQNLHQAGDPPQDLTIFIASNYKAKGTIELLGPGKTTLWTQAFNVDSQGVYEVAVPHGFNQYAEIQDGNNEKPLRNAIHVTADQPIVVYGLNHIQYTTDGFLAIPPSAWGTNYQIASYIGITRTDEYPTIRATSEFAVVAAYDNTSVSILLTDNTMDGNGNKTHDKDTQVNFILNKGEVYQMQALKVIGEYNDLSGTIVTSTKPIGVLSGVKCTDVPVTHTACDYILEMIPPTDTWGKEYFTYPFEPTRKGGDMWRVFALEDGTDVFLNGNKIGQVNPSDPVTKFFETTDLQKSELNSAAHWTFSKPVLMCQYICGQDYDGSDHGDPSFVVLETREQFERGVVFANPPDADGFINYINVVVNDSAGTTAGLRDSLYLDGYPIKNLPSGTYLLMNSGQVPGTSFYIYHVKIPGGVHRLKAQSDFSAYSVGLKPYESYAWACALSLKNIKSTDTIAPVMPIVLTCGELTDTLQDLPHDTTQTDLAEIGTDGEGIGWLRDSTYNFDLQVFADPNGFTPGDSAALMHIKVTNLRKNAHGALFVVDRAGNSRIYDFDYIADSVTATPAARTFGTVHPPATKTDSIIIKNPLSKSVTVDSLWLVKNTVFKIISGGAPFPFTMAPGDQRSLVIKYSPTADGFDDDTVMVAFECFLRPLALVFGGSGTPCLVTSDLDFGTLTLPVGGGSASVDSILTVSSTGSDTLIVTDLRISGGAASAFSIVSPTVPLATPDTILPGDEVGLKVKIHFVASASTSYHDSLIVVSNATCQNADNIGDLRGAGQAPGPGIAGFDWGDKRVACPFPDNGFTVTNSGTSPDTLISLTIVSGNVSDFKIQGSNPLNIPLDPNSSTHVVATFTPSDTGYRWVIVRAVFKSGYTKSDTMLRGTGIHPILTSKDVDFGALPVGASFDSIVVGLNLPKTYGDGLTVDSVWISGPDAGDFQFVDKNIPHTLASGGDTMQVRVRFTPAAGGARAAMLCFRYNGSFVNCNDTVSTCVSLTGSGTIGGITLSNWDAQRWFITTTGNGNVTVTNPAAVGGAMVHVDSVRLAQGKFFAIDFGAGRTPAQFDLAPQGTQDVFLKFTPQDTVTYYDTVLVYNNSSTPLVKGFVQGTGKVVIYTLSVPTGIHGAFGNAAAVPISVATVGYTRPSAPGVDPGDPTPLDSGQIASMRLALRFDPSVLMPATTDNASIVLAGAITAGYTPARVATTQDSIAFTLTGGPALVDHGLLATVRFTTLYAPTAGTAIDDTVSTTVPWVLWKYVPGLFALDSICGLGQSTKILYQAPQGLEQSMPNPASTADGVTAAYIPFAVDRDMNVSLVVFNTMGSEVARLVDGPVAKGSYVAPISIVGLPAGMYYYRLSTDESVQTRTMVVMH